jgi:membrane-associated phospholipid phosphatase
MPSSLPTRLIVVAGLALAGPAHADAPAPEPLRYDLRVDVPIAGVAMAGWLTSELLKGQLGAATCRWCDSVPGIDRAARDGLKWQDTERANTISNVTGFALAPLAAVGLTALAAQHDGALGNAGIDTLLIAEATALAVDLNQIVKFSVGRERPFVHALAPADKLLTAHPADNNASFYSGHTNLVFALAVSSGTVASMRGYRWAPAVWVGGLTVAATTGYLRIAADRHYFTDVALGAAVGSAIGFAVPWLMHRAGSKAPIVTAGVGTAGGALTWAW